MSFNYFSVVVVVGDVTSDSTRIFLPKLTVCALRFTKMARTRIEAAGGKCLSFDQLAMIAPTGYDKSSVCLFLPDKHFISLLPLCQHRTFVLLCLFSFQFKLHFIAWKKEFT